MKSLPTSPDLSHLKRQAKQLLREACALEMDALDRFAENFPAMRAFKRSPQLAAELRLHDAQSVIAREYGFRSWPELKRFVEWKQTDGTQHLKSWLKWVYEGSARDRNLAIRTLAEQPEAFAGNAWVACATGDEAALQRMLSKDEGWANRPGGPLGMPPLVAVTHSLLICEPEFEPHLLESARLLLGHGADVNCAWTNPDSPGYPLSSLYGAAGKTHHVAMLKLLLEAGPNLNDNESLYHSVESRDSACTRLLLEAGAPVVGTNAIGRVLDYGKLDDLRLMLQHGGDANERPWIHHAILRGRSIEHIRLLVGAGADLNATNHDGTSLYRRAQLHGRTDVLEILRSSGIEETLTEEEEFVAACARGDLGSAQAILQRIPDVFSRLTDKQLQAMPQHAGIGDKRAVRTMLNVGWPLEVKTAWDATALNLAVYRGDAEIANLLLTSGASWSTKHGFGDNVLGTLAHASQNNVEDPSSPRDYLGCARALVAHDVPLPDTQYTFSPEVETYFEAVRLQRTIPKPVEPTSSGE